MVFALGEKVFCPSVRKYDTCLRIILKGKTVVAVENNSIRVSAQKPEKYSELYCM